MVPMISTESVTAKVSVIIPCFNAVDTIADQLETLASQHCPYSMEVIVSDNGSTDDTRRVVEDYRGKLENLVVVDSSDQSGASYARNVGVEASTGDILLFCDADDIVGDEWLMIMSDAVIKHDFVACRLDTQKLNDVWLQKSWKNSQKDGPIEFYPPYLPCAGGCSIGVKRSLHEAVGGFDESFRSVEDIDYSWRIQLAGAKLHFIHNTEVYYRYPKKISKMYLQMRGIGENAALLYKKYQPMGMPKIKNPLKKGINDWIRLVKNIPRLRRKTALAGWVRAFGLRVGRIRGSLKHRVIYL